MNNAAEQHVASSLEDISAAQLERTFRTNIYGYFFLTKAALRLLDKGGCIVNSTSITAYRGSGHLLDYSGSDHSPKRRPIHYHLTQLCAHGVVGW